MQELIAGGNDSLMMSSREIADLCEKQHKDVLRDIRVMFEQLEIDSAQFCAQYKDATGRELPCFNLDKEMAITLVAGYKVVLRNRIVKRWMELEAAAAPRHVLPQTFSQALALAAEQAAQIEQQQAQLQAAKPAIEHHEAVKAAENHISMAHMSRVLTQAGHKIGRNRLIDLLRDAGVLFRGEGIDRNTPTQEMMDRGYFRVTESTSTRSNGEKRIHKTTYVTGKGECWILENFAKLKQRAQERGKR